MKLTKKEEKIAKTKALARQWLRTRRNEKKAALKRQALGEILIEVMKRSGELSIKIGKNSVAVVSQLQKRIYKTTLEKVLGKKKADEVWKKIPSVREEYLSEVAGG